MTPLAHKIVKDALSPPHLRKVYSEDKVVPFGVLPLMHGTHCFEMTDVYEMAIGLSRQIFEKDVSPDNSSFLPAPNSWFEFKHPHEKNHRIAILAIQDPDDNKRLLVRFCASYPELTFVVPGIVFWDMAHQSGKSMAAKLVGIEDDSRHWILGLLELLRAFLAIVNTPDLVGRRQHLPHLGLARDLRHVKSEGGKPFELKPWTQILLEATPPSDMSDVEGYEPRLTGKKALHFCRAHLRMVGGRVVFVRSHFRGDASLGVVRADYKVLPPKGGAA